MKRVAVLVGSLRRQSLNLKFAKAVSQLAKPRLDCSIADLADLPMYNDDLWQAPPSPVLTFKETIRTSDAVLFVTPEYNRSIPPVLKNAIDWASRPKDDNVWNGKPGAVAGASPGMIGTAVGQAHLRYVASVVGIALMPVPEVYFSLKTDTIDDAFRFQKKETIDFIASFIDAFDRWIDRTSRQ
jgi:chromate reductase